jgi:hypothetical protein
MASRLLRDHLPARMTIALSAVFLALLLGAGPAHAATWTIQTTPNDPVAEHSASYDIGCGSNAIKVCVSVGKLAKGAESAPYAQAWNGSTWTNSAVPKPVGSTTGELQAVDCVSEATCYASGSYVGGSGTVPLAARWGSGTWALMSPLVPPGASSASFKGMGCALVCFAVGQSVTGGETKALAESWNLEKWSILTIPTPAGAKSSELHGADCATLSACAFVGSYVDESGKTRSMAIMNVPKAWTLYSIPEPAESLGSTLLDVSCASTTSCTAVGGYRNAKNVQLSFVQRWNGTTWSHQSSPNPSGSTNTVFQNVACTEGTLCVAVGDWRNSSNVWQPMAQEWTGLAWALDTTPTPAGAAFSLLEGAACNPTECLATGWYTNSEGKDRTLGEKR